MTRLASLRRKQLATCLLTCIALFLGPTGLEGKETDARISQIEGRFVSPCCWRENLAVHDSQVAEQLRALITQMVESGRTESQIVDYMVARFGERILREPTGARFGFLTITPIIALGIGFLLVIRYLLHARHLTLRESNTRAVLPLSAEDFEWR
jgi:cytochrome c-type biogenesis protein CcmH